MKRAYLCLIMAVTSIGCQLAAEPATETPTPALSAGAREVQITSTRDRGKVHQDMYARSLVLSDGSTRIAVLTLDCVGLGLGHTVQIREGIAKATGIPADHVTINNSHTHNAGWPSGEWQDGMTYGDWLVKTCVAITAEANQALEPCAIGYDRVPIQIGFNRRLVQDDGQVTMAINPDGPVVPWTDVIAINASERSARIAVLFTYAAHPVITQFSDVISSDYPGSAIARLKKLLGGGGRPEDGGVFMFGQGCGANINAFPLRGGPEACDAVGAKLANALLRADLEGMTPGPIRAEWLTLSLPYQQPPSVAEVETAIEDNPEDERLKKLLKTAQEGDNRRSLDYPMTAMAIGPDLCILSLPYETFCDYQLFADKVSPFSHTVTLGYCVGGGYIATAAAYEMGPRGGYEASPFMIALSSKYGLALDPSVEKIIQDGIVELLTKLKQGANDE